METDRRQARFTLIEVILVIVIIGIMATVALRSMQPTVGQAKVEATMQEMDLLAEAIVGDESLVEGNMSKQFGYAGDGGAMPPNLDSLAANRGSYSTWDKPHVRRTSNTKTSMAMGGASCGSNYFSRQQSRTIKSVGSGDTVAVSFQRSFEQRKEASP